MVGIPPQQPQAPQGMPPGMPPQGQPMAPPQPQKPVPQIPPRHPNSGATLDGPVPGESLTATPGNAPYEHPPQYTDPHDALNFIFQRILQPTTIKGVLTMLKMGVPAEAVAKVLLFSGFSNGKWTVDLCMLLLKPVMAIVVAIGQRANIKMKIAMKNMNSGKVINDLVKDRTENKRPIPASNMETAVSVLKSLGDKPDDMSDNTETM